MKSHEKVLFLIPSISYSFFEVPHKTPVTLRFSTHKSLFFRVRNIFPPYSGPPSIAQDVALALTRALTRQSALTRAHALAGKGRLFSGAFRKNLEFLPDFSYATKSF